MKRIHKNGLDIVLIPSKKYKTVQLMLRLMNDLNKETLNERVLVSKVLLASSKNYPSKKLLEQAYDKNYGMIVSGSQSKLGNQHIVSFYMSVVDEAFIDHETNLLKDSFRLFSSLMNEPLMEGGLFKESVVNEEIRLLQEELKSVYHDKTQYSMKRFKEVMFENENYALVSKGELSTLGEVSPKDITNRYHSMIQNDYKELYVIGHFNEEEILSCIETQFSYSEVSFHGELIDQEASKRTTSQIITEQDDITQTKIYFGYRTDIRYLNTLYAPFFIGNTILGETDQSLLFKKLREELQLCYSVQSSYDSNKGFLMIAAGIRKDNKEKIQEKVKEMIELIAKGEFSDQLLNYAKETLIRRQKKSLDSQLNEVFNQYYSIKFKGKPFDFEEKVNEINAITKEDIMKAFQTIKLDTIYIYEGEDDHEED